MIDAPLATPVARCARARILDLARHRQADPEFLLEMSEQLRRIVPFAGAFWSASDPLTTLATSPARVERMDGQCERFWEREFLFPDFNLCRDLAREKRPVSSLYRATGGRPTGSIRYREISSELGYGDELRAVFRSGNAAWGMVALWREEGQQPFSSSRVKLIADVSPQITLAFRRAALLQASTANTAPDSPGLLVFDQNGALQSFNDQAEARLSELHPPAGLDRESYRMPVPTEIRAVVALSHAIAAGVEQGTARIHVQGRSGRWLVIEGFPLRGAGESANQTAVMIQPAQASEVAPLIVEAYDLSPREQQITQLIARGFSTATIAHRLGLSPHTVRDYVKSVLEKVGVSSRGELIAGSFASHYQGALNDSVVHAPAGRE